MERIALIILFLFTALLSWSQADKKAFIQGNKALNDSVFNQALDHYSQVNAMSSWKNKADYNSALAALGQDSLALAQKSLENFIAGTKNKEHQAKAFHNLGNLHLEQGQLEESVNAYKEALKRNPHDEETRYNYAYAKNLLKQQQDQEKKDQDKQEKEDQKDEEKKKNEEKEEEKKEEEKEQNQEQEQQDQQQQEQQQQQQQQQQKSASKQQAEQMLDALNQAEKGIQKKVNKQKSKGQKIKIEKDW